MSCIFCAIAEGRVPSTRIYEDDVCIAFMDINPATRGHCLVVPRTHSVDLTDTSDETLSHMIRVARRVGRAALDGLSADGFNLLQCTGQAAFQSVFHVHFHVIPRYAGDGLKVPWTHRHQDLQQIQEAGATLRGALAGP